MKSKNKSGNSIHIRKYGKKLRYVYYDKATKKRITASIYSFRDINEFKNYIRNKGYLFGSKIYESRTSNIKQGVNYDFIFSKKFLGKKRQRYVVVAEYDYRGHILTGNSAPKFSHSKETLVDAKQQAVSVIAQQMLKYFDPAKYSDRYSDEYLEAAENIMSDKIDYSRVKYSFIYSREKNA
jgi:hypothetical protein